MELLSKCCKVKVTLKGNLDGSAYYVCDFCKQPAEVFAYEPKDKFSDEDLPVWSVRDLVKKPSRLRDVPYYISYKLKIFAKVTAHGGKISYREKVQDLPASEKEGSRSIVPGSNNNQEGILPSFCE